MVDLYRVESNLFQRYVDFSLKYITEHEKIVNEYLPCIYSPYDPENLLPDKNELSQAYYKFVNIWLSLQTDLQEFLV